MAGAGDIERRPKLQPAARRMRSRVLSDVLWALDAAAQAPEVRRAMGRTAPVHGAALAILAALLVHAAMHGLR